MARGKKTWATATGAIGEVVRVLASSAVSGWPGGLLVVASGEGAVAAAGAAAMAVAAPSPAIPPGDELGATRAGAPAVPVNSPDGAGGDLVGDVDGEEGDDASDDAADAAGGGAAAVTMPVDAADFVGASLAPADKARKAGHGSWLGLPGP